MEVVDFHVEVESEVVEVEVLAADHSLRIQMEVDHSLRYIQMEVDMLKVEVDSTAAADMVVGGYDAVAGKS